MTTPSEELGQALEIAGIATRGATSGWAVFGDLMNDEPDTAISLEHAGGPEPDRVLGEPNSATNMNIIAKVRALGKDAAYTKAVEVRDRLGSIAGETILGAYWIQCIAISAPALQSPAPDEKGRWTYDVSFLGKRAG